MLSRQNVAHTCVNAEMRQLFTIQAAALFCVSHGGKCYSSTATTAMHEPSQAAYVRHPDACILIQYRRESNPHLCLVSPSSALPIERRYWRHARHATHKRHKYQQPPPNNAQCTHKAHKITRASTNHPGEMSTMHKYNAQCCQYWPQAHGGQTNSGVYRESYSGGSAQRLLAAALCQAAATAPSVPVSAAP